jgi:hypothetical protein
MIYYDHVGNAMRLYTAATERMRIDSSGNVGIGTASPNHELDVKAATNSGISITPATGNATNYLDWYDTGGGPYGRLGYNHQTSTMTFSTVNTERMRMDSAGRIFMNSQTDSDGVLNIENQSGDYCIAVKDKAVNSAYILFRNSAGNATGSILRSGTSTSFNTTSDYRLKENVTDISDGITRVKQLAPKRFNFIEEPDRTVDGFLAHEAQAVVAEAVHGTKDELEVWAEGEELPDGVSVGDNKLDDDGNTIPKMQGIDQAKLVPLLTAALQEAIAKIETLETKVAALEAE